MERRCLRQALLRNEIGYDANGHASISVFLDQHPGGCSIRISNRRSMRCSQQEHAADRESYAAIGTLLEEVLGKPAVPDRPAAAGADAQNVSRIGAQEMEHGLEAADECSPSDFLRLRCAQLAGSIGGIERRGQGGRAPIRSYTQPHCARIEKRLVPEIAVAGIAQQFEEKPN
jgi:hypothetical protein